MRYLVDTHTLLWFLREPDKLPPDVLKTIENAGEETGVSLASLWEIAIKVSLNKLHLPKPFEELFPQSVPESGLALLPIESRHLAEVSCLPFHHRDPFDRMMIAQAKAEGLAIITCDPHFSAYGVPLIW
jgi:PIN domain nuclease of toxin-antitoxin system